MTEKIHIEFVYALNFKEAEYLWEKRKKRINKNRIFVKMGIDATELNRDACLKAFDNVSFPKICFYSGETSVKDVVCMNRFKWQCYQGKRMNTVCYSGYMREMGHLFKGIDVLKLLNGEKDYIREE